MLDVTSSIRLEPIMIASLGGPTGQLRAVPVSLGPHRRPAVLAVHAADYDVDPWSEMFFFPTDSPKLTLLADDGQVLWRRDLGRGVVPGMWFLPVLAFDLDGDGVDEIWLVNNLDAAHPLGLRRRVLERLDATTGQTTGQWPWPDLGGGQTLSHTHRNFIVGGHVAGLPVLLTAQGTYGPMFLQGYRPDMSRRWELAIAADSPGARGSHMCPIVDLADDGRQALMWGERCIDLDGGAELFCADRDSYRGHSDVVQPVRDRDGGRWLLYTCRESDNDVAPRVAMFDAGGRLPSRLPSRLWGHLDRGHIDMGWVARLGPAGEPVAMAIRIGVKESGPTGQTHHDREEFCYDAITGQPIQLPYSTYTAVPVDLDGDGRHELAYANYKGNGQVIDRTGRPVGTITGRVAMACKFLDRPGEQLLSFSPDGTVRVWADRNAADSPAARVRYAEPVYQANRRLTASGSNLNALGGI